MSTEQKPQEAPPQKPARHEAHIPWGGIVLIVLGIVFLLQQFGIQWNNWWALFILIPAISSLSTAWITWRRSGTFNAAARSAFGGGLILLTLTVMFLLDLDWTVYWPLMLIVPGFSIMLGGLPDRSLDENQTLRSYVGLGLWIGIAMILLGGVFLYNNLASISLLDQFAFRWYGVIILIPGIGAVINALIIFHRNGNKFVTAARVLLGIGLVICVFAGLVLAGLDWKLLGAIMVIAAGLIVLLSAWIK
jgi:hypothetical protein